MGKKKRQVDHSIHAGGDSSDSVEENQTKISVTMCPHANKAIHLTGVKKVLKGNGLPQECQECTKNSVSRENSNGERYPLVICLKCGHLACMGEHKHAELHSKNRQSDVHDLAISPDTWIVLCFKCDTEVPSISSKKLLECVEYVKKNVSKEGNSLDKEIAVCYALPPPEIKNVPTVLTSDHSVPSSQPTQATSLPKVRGLSNLGNTCFFNAVLQCLGQTPFLLHILEEMKDPGEKFKLPGGEVVIGEEKENLEPLEGELKEWSPLTKTLADTLAEIQSGKTEVFSPSRLLSHVHNKCPQFAGYDQHDSHELLRQLLEMVRTEDLQRYQQSILEVLKLDKKSERHNITDDMKRKVKAYGRQANDLMLRPEHVFRGFLVSTLQCQECDHTSDHIESFLDLSLPVMADKPIHVRRKSSSEDVGDTSPSPSKHQLKKERKAASRGRKGKHKKETEKTIDEEKRKSSGESEEEDESDADVEDNIEGEVAGQDVIESGYSSEKLGNGDSACGSPASESNIHLNRDSAIASPITHDTGHTLHKPTDQLLDLAIPEHSLLKDSAIISSPGSQLSMACQPSPMTSSSETNLCRLSPTDQDAYTPLAMDRPTSRFDYCPDKPEPMEISSDFQPSLTSMTSSFPTPVDNGNTFYETSQYDVSTDGIKGLEAEFSTLEVPGEEDVAGVDDWPLAITQNEGDTENGKTRTENWAETVAERLEEGTAHKTLNQNQSIVWKATVQMEESCDVDGGAENAEGGSDGVVVQNNAENAAAAEADEGVTGAATAASNGVARTRSDDWTVTMAQRCRDTDPSSDCTLLSCLNQFTAKELMTGNNKVGCEQCTRHHNQGKEGKTVCTNASKQLLISSPPAVLILHLKRFQVVRCMFKKKSREVKFPTSFDLASYCSIKCKDTPTVKKDQTQLLYSLYGVVEHIGTLYGGHYVAYVKVRAPLEPDDPRWHFLPQRGSTALAEKTNREDGVADLGAVGGAPQPPPGKWYYVSDSHASEVKEESVLRSQAYLLFYERIW